MTTPDVARRADRLAYIMQQRRQQKLFVPRHPRHRQVVHLKAVIERIAFGLQVFKPRGGISFFPRNHAGNGCGA